MIVIEGNTDTEIVRGEYRQSERERKRETERERDKGGDRQSEREIKGETDSACLASITYFTSQSRVETTFNRLLRALKDNNAVHSTVSIGFGPVTQVKERWRPSRNA